VLLSCYSVFSLRPLLTTRPFVFGVYTYRLHQKRNFSSLSSVFRWVLLWCCRGWFN